MKIFPTTRRSDSAADASLEVFQITTHVPDEAISVMDVFNGKAQTYLYNIVSL